MADCSDSKQTRGSANPIQSKIVENNHGSSGGSSGDNTIENMTCDASVAVGNVVRLNGTTIVNAQADSVTNAKVIGICVSKSAATTCNVQVTGFTDDILAGLTTNTRYFLSATTAGQLSTTVPSSSGHVVQQIGISKSSTSIVINITLGMVRS